MIQKNVEQLVQTVKSWSDDERKNAILVVECIRGCFSTDDRLVEKKEENGQMVVTEGQFLTAELTELINRLK